MERAASAPRASSRPGAGEAEAPVSATRTVPPGPRPPAHAPRPRSIIDHAPRNSHLVRKATRVRPGHTPPPPPAPGPGGRGPGPGRAQKGRGGAGRAGRAPGGWGRSGEGPGRRAGRPSPTPCEWPRPRPPRSGQTTAPSRPPPRAGHRPSASAHSLRPKGGRDPHRDTHRGRTEEQADRPRRGSARRLAPRPACGRIASTRRSAPLPTLSSPPPFASFRVRRRRFVRGFRLCAGAVPLPRRLAI